MKRGERFQGRWMDAWVDRYFLYLKMEEKPYFVISYFIG